MTGQPTIEDMLRETTPKVLGALGRRHGTFDECENAVQEALAAAGAARAAYQQAARKTTSVPEQRYLFACGARVGAT